MTGNFAHRDCFQWSGFKTKWINDGLPHWYYTATTSGSVSCQIMYSWLNEVFTPYLEQKKSEDEKCLLIMDKDYGTTNTRFQNSCESSGVVPLYYPLVTLSTNDSDDDEVISAEMTKSEIIERSQRNLERRKKQIDRLLVQVAELEFEKNRLRSEVLLQQQLQQGNLTEAEVAKYLEDEDFLEKYASVNYLLKRETIYKTITRIINNNNWRACLRKKVTVFQQPHYTENFIQSILDAIPEGSQGSTLVIGGDGRFYNDVVIQLIIKIAAANGVKKLILGQNGILSTPATSHVIRIKQATGGIILTASHNPGGPQNDLGIKYNLGNGGPAPESVTNKIYEISKQINQYKLIELPNVDLSKIGTIVEGPIEIEIIDSTKDYVDMLKSIFDFPLIKSFIDKATKEQDFKVLFDALNGVTGPYGYEIFVNELGLPESSIQNYKPLPDFGGLHPDPNLTYAHTLVERVDKENIAFGAASDGDGDRNMIYGAGTFVSPGDSVAIISEYADSIPYFQKQGVMD
ncbi:Phosphoglucomutase/phosphomannomutase, alpha/beta/alpha domain I family protein [Candida albicans]|uniref:phosphoglucomutase (alpha-D-glucose-1,6-bisphosphate-dependent) n=1 Tax=Candida albicans TaxID=5476 RepID=A0A8H6F257_CANAX|nr:Phosphoglucomutase/phosphomannomutase, alpha/beta/alpha domain I family protein [Candida albicans]